MKKSPKLLKKNCGLFAGNFLIIAIAALSLSGCVSSKASYLDIIDQARQVDVTDGLSKEEAVVLAQRHLVMSRYDENHQVFDGRAVHYDASQESWWVDFPSAKSVFSREGYQFHRRVIVQPDGKIKTSFIKKY